MDITSIYLNLRTKESDYVQCIVMVKYWTFYIITYTGIIFQQYASCLKNQFVFYNGRRSLSLGIFCDHVVGV